MESQGKTLEVDTMYLVGIPPWKSSRYSGREVMGGEPLVSADNLRLNADAKF